MANPEIQATFSSDLVDQEYEAMRDEVTRPPEPVQSGGWRNFTEEHMRKPVTDDEIPNRLFGELVYEGEFVILAADSGVGKSAIGEYMVIAARTHGACLFGHPELKNCTGSLPSKYCDAETDELTMRIRHGSMWEGEYKDNRGVPEQILEATPEEQREWTKQAGSSLLDIFFEAAVLEGKRFCVLDSMTKASTATEAKYMRQMLREIRAIKALAERKHGHSVTVVVLAHTRKDVEPGRYLSVADLYGGMEQKADADVVLRAGNSRKKDYFYIAQKKTSRYRRGVFTGEANGEVIHVARCSVPRPEGTQLVPEYHLRMDDYRPVYENEVMLLPNNAHMTEDSAKDKAESLADTITTMKVQGKENITPSMVHNCLRDLKKKDSSVIASNVDTITKLWPQVIDLLRENGGTDVINAMAKVQSK